MSTEQDKAVVAAVGKLADELRLEPPKLVGVILDVVGGSRWLADLLAERDQARASVAAVRELVEHREQRYDWHGGIRAVPVADLRRALDRHAVTHAVTHVEAHAGSHAGTEAHSLARKPPGGGGGHTPGVGWMCTGCEWRFSYDVPEERARSVWDRDYRHSPGMSGGTP